MTNHIHHLLVSVSVVAPAPSANPETNEINGTYVTHREVIDVQYKDTQLDLYLRKTNDISVAKSREKDSYLLDNQIGANLKSAPLFITKDPKYLETQNETFWVEIRGEWYGPNDFGEEDLEIEVVEAE